MAQETRWGGGFRSPKRCQDGEDSLSGAEFAFWSAGPDSFGRVTLWKTVIQDSLGCLRNIFWKVRNMFFFLERAEQGSEWLKLIQVCATQNWFVMLWKPIARTHAPTCFHLERSWRMVGWLMVCCLSLGSHWYKSLPETYGASLLRKGFGSLRSLGMACSSMLWSL